jgi:hypothetical protein
MFKYELNLIPAYNKKIEILIYWNSSLNNLNNLNNIDNNINYIILVRILIMFADIEEDDIDIFDEYGNHFLKCYEILFGGAFYRNLITPRSSGKIKMSDLLLCKIVSMNFDNDDKNDKNDKNDNLTPIVKLTYSFERNGVVETRTTQLYSRQQIAYSDKSKFDANDYAYGLANDIPFMFAKKSIIDIVNGQTK